MGKKNILSNPFSLPGAPTTMDETIVFGFLPVTSSGRGRLALLQIERCGGGGEEKEKGITKRRERPREACVHNKGS